MRLFSMEAVRIPRKLCFCIFHIAIATVATAADSFHYVSATPDNTRMADGSPLPELLESIGWQWNPERGNGGIFESHEDDLPQADTLMLVANGLEPGSVYEVIGLIWVDDAKTENTASQSHQPVKLGLTLATLHPFDGERPDRVVMKEPWVITPGYTTGEAFGFGASLVKDEPLQGLPNTHHTSDSSVLIQARLGCSRAGKNGSLPVFFSTFHSDWSSGQSIIDGVALRPADPDAEIEQGWKSGTRLHHAIRTGDQITIRREIESECDLNAFDEERLTPLFHATASCDLALIRELLKRGADPNQSRQSVSPLVAAASHSDPDAAKLLLDAGAKVPLESPTAKGALAIKIDPRSLHPAVAAIRSGSLPVLKLLLEKQPTLDIESLYTDLEKIEIERRYDPEIPDPYLVAYSMANHNWEMAAFLIDRGCQIASWGISHYESPAATMMARAVSAGEDGMPVVEAMLRRGIPPVLERSVLSTPLDALSAAAWTGNAQLFKRFLPLARDSDSRYQQCLLHYALYSENAEIVALTRQQFPDLKLPRAEAKPVAESIDQFEAGSERLFLPRTRPLKQSYQSISSKDRVLAVISSPEAADAGDLLSATASGVEGWKVVDRELIESALNEDTFTKPWTKGVHRLSDIGDRLTADCLIVISAIKAGEAKIYRIEVVEVETGLEIHREHLKDSSFHAPDEIIELLRRSTTALDAASQNDRHEAMTLLSFFAQEGVKDPSVISRILRATIQREIDTTPGLISLSRAQSSRLVEEQALSGKNSLWGASHLIEGVVSAVDKDQIKVSLRLETLKDGTSIKTDAEAVGTPVAIADTTAKAWAELRTKSRNRQLTSSPSSDLRTTALSEGRRLLREAEWLHSSDAEPDQYLPLIESALALGVPADEAVRLNLDGMLCRFKFLKWRRSRLDDGKATTKHQHLPEIFRNLPHSLSASDELLSQISEVREFLHLTSWYLDRFEERRLTDPSQDQAAFHESQSLNIWHSIQALCYLRSIVYRKELPKECQEDHRLFCLELDALTRRYFSGLKDEFDPDPSRYSLLFSDTYLFQRNPELVDGLAEMALTEAPLRSLLLTGYRGFITRGDGIDKALYGWMEPRKQLAHRMIEKIGNTSSPYLSYKKADLECFVAEQKDRPKAIRRLLDAQARVFAQTGPYNGEMDYDPVSKLVLERGTTSYLFYAFPMATRLDNAGSMLPSLLLSPRPAPDFLIRHRIYQMGFNALRRARLGEVEDQHPALLAFKQRMKSEDPATLDYLKKRNFRKRKSRGRTKIEATNLSKNTHSLLYGSGKPDAPQESPNRVKSNSPALQATLLTDLRRGDDPGVAIWPLVDRVNPNLLWIYYFPSTTDKIPVDLPGNGAQSRNTLYKAPYLLAIDCTDGTVVRKIDLHAAVGSAYGEDLSARTCRIWDMAFDQTESRILTNIGFSHKGYASNKMAAVVIDKATGEPHRLPNMPIISESSLHRHGGPWDFRVGVVGVGEHFFFLARGSGRNGGAVRGAGSSALSIFHIAPDLSISPLTVLGRRPEMTPFDAIDRAPMAIVPDQDRLWIANSTTIAHYTPETEKWDISKKPSPMAQAKAFAEEKEKDFLDSLHKIHYDGKSTEWTAIAWQHPSGVIPFSSEKHGRLSIPFAARMPEDFLSNTLVNKRVSKNKDRSAVVQAVPLKEHPKSQSADLIVFAQTETDLILGMQTGDYYELKRPSRNAVHFPFLWKISKKELLEKLNNRRSESSER